MGDGQARFPAEWEPQSAILLAWPHAGTDWSDRLGEVEDSYIALVAAITRFQPAIVCVADADVEAYARARLASAGSTWRVRFVEPNTTTLLRDTGPITRGQGFGCSISGSPAGAEVRPGATTRWCDCTKLEFSE